MTELKMLEMMAYQAIEFDKLQKKLEIATKALEKYAKQKVFGQIARDALMILKEMEEV